MTEFVQNKALANKLLKYACDKYGFDYATLIGRLASESFQRLIIENVFTFENKPEEHAILAGAISMWKLYSNCPLTISEYADMYKVRLLPDVYTFLKTNSEELSKFINFEIDFEMTYFQTSMFTNMILATLKKGRTPFEVPQFLWLRLAVAQFKNRGTSKSTSEITAKSHPRTGDGSLGAALAKHGIYSRSPQSHVPSGCALGASSDLLTDSKNINFPEGVARGDNSFHIISNNCAGNADGEAGGHIPASEATLQEIKCAYELFSRNYIIPASPTMFNMGFNTGAAASCMLYTIADEMEDILDVYKEAGMATKNNAGLGICYSYLRHSPIGYEGPSQGVIPLAVIHDRTLRYIDQGGKRPGAMCGTLIIHHYDVPEFIKLRDTVGEDEVKAKTMNTCIMLTDYFFQRLEEDGEWTLFCPKETPLLNGVFGKEYAEVYVMYEKKAEEWSQYQKYLAMKELFEYGGADTDLDAGQKLLYKNLADKFSNSSVPDRVSCRKFKASVLMQLICKMQKTTSHPFINHWDNIQRKNNMDNVGPVDSLNLCQEIAIARKAKEETGCCILASLSIGKFVRTHINGVKTKYFDWDHFVRAVDMCVKSLNGVIDTLENVSDKVKKSNNNSRPIAIGVNGFANALFNMDIPYVDPNATPKKADGTPDYSEESLKQRKTNPAVIAFNYKLWSCMYYNALRTSCSEAKEYGAYPLFWSSKTAQGILQYHLWQQEEKDTGRKYPFELVPLEPSTWGQEGSWTELIEDIKKYGLRNALLLACQPTASSSNIASACEMTEPYMLNVFVRKVLTGDYISMNYDMVHDFEDLGIWNKATFESIRNNQGSVLFIPEAGLSEKQVTRLRFLKEKYLTIFEMPQKVLVELAGRRQVFIDHTQSFNVNIAKPDEKVLEHIHRLTHKWGLKTGLYYLRTRGASDPLDIRHREDDQVLDEVLTKLKPAASRSKKVSVVGEIVDQDVQKLIGVVQDKQKKYQDYQNNIIHEV